MKNVLTFLVTVVVASAVGAAAGVIISNPFVAVTPSETKTYHRFSIG